MWRGAREGVHCAAIFARQGVVYDRDAVAAPVIMSKIEAVSDRWTDQVVQLELVVVLHSLGRWRKEVKRT